jgi:hypothetical protein
MHAAANVIIDNVMGSGGWWSAIEMHIICINNLQ